MNLDDLIPFIILLGIILFNILKRLAKGKQEKEPSEKPAKKKAFGLSKLVDTIKAELELAGLEPKQQKEKAKTLIHDAEFGKVEAGEAELSEAELMRAGFEGDDLEEILKDETIREDLPKFARKVEKKKKPMVPGLPGDIKKRKQRRVPKLSVSKMREAIVLSEIIAKPVGLRDEPF